jgi:hypothetical protein
MAGQPEDSGKQAGRLASRRGVLLGALGGTGVALLGRAVGGQGTPPVATPGDCSRVPALRLFADWIAGKPVLRPEELRPPLDWVVFNQFGAPVSFLHPGDWIPSALFASGLTPAGAIAWETTPSPTTFLAASRIVSPDGQALYEYVAGVLAGVALTLDEAAMAAEQGVLGNDGTATVPICAEDDPAAFGPSWMRAGRFGELVVTTGGSLLSDPSGGSPFTTLNYQSFVGPEARYTELMRTVFIPIMYQLLMAGAGTLEPTPTPRS